MAMDDDKPTPNTVVPAGAIVCKRCGTAGDRYLPDRAICKQCGNADLRARRAKNREHVRRRARESYQRNRAAALATAKAYVARNREKVLARQREYHRKTYAQRKADAVDRAKAWHQQNRDKARAANAKWRAKNPDYWRKHRAADRAKARRAGTRKNRIRRAGRDRKAYAYSEIIRRDPCSYCGATGGEVDHIDPIDSGGVNEWWNLTGACHACNGQKWTTPLLLFLLRRVQCQHHSSSQSEHQSQPTSS